MNVNDEIRKKAIKWIEFAEEDLRLAKHSLALESSCPFRLTAYHAEQCAEKYLKAFLVSNRVDFPYTHSIIRLLELCSTLKSFGDIQKAENLSPYSIATRYPGEDEVVRQD